MKKSLSTSTKWSAQCQFTTQIYVVKFRQSCQILPQGLKYLNGTCISCQIIIHFNVDRIKFERIKICFYQPSILVCILQWKFMNSLKQYNIHKYLKITFLC